MVAPEREGACVGVEVAHGALVRADGEADVASDRVGGLAAIDAGDEVRREVQEPAQLGGEAVP